MSVEKMVVEYAVVLDVLLTRYGLGRVASQEVLHP